MTFLSPGFLWLAPAALVPLALHLRGRRGAPRRSFSDVALLRAAAGAWYHPDRWRHLLLLLVRTLLAAGAVLFLAGPVWRPSGGGPAGGPAWILLDASYSMGAAEVGRSVFESARARAREIIDGLPPGARAGVLLFSDRVESVLPPTADRGALRRFLEGAAPNHRPTDVGAALSALPKETAGSAEPWTVYVVSDMAAHGWRSARPSLPDGNTRWALCEVGTDYSNGAMTEVRGLWDPSTARVRGNLSVRAWGPLGRPERGWSVAVAGERPVTGRVALVGGPGEATFASPPVRSPVLTVAARVEPDPLPEDDVFYAVVPRRDPPSFLIVNGSPNLSPVSDEAHYLQPVLEAWEKDGARVRTAWPGEISDAALAGIDAVALLNVGSLPAPAWTALETFVRRGGGLWITAGDQWSAAAVPSFAPFRAGPAVDVDDGAAPALSSAPFGSFGAGPDVDWSDLRVRRSVGVEPGPGAAVLLRGRPSGRALLVAGPVGDGRVALWATSIDRDWTGAPASPLFPVLCRDVLSYLARAEAASAPAPETVGGVWTGRRSGAVAALLRRPDGRSERLTGRAGEFRAGPLELPGFYRLQFPSGGETVFAVNASRDAEEGNPARVPRDVPERWFGPGRTVWIGAGDDLSRTLAGSPLRPLLRRGLLVLFVLETLMLFFRRVR